MLKKCCACHVRKPPSNFNWRARSKDGLQQICRECSAARSRLYYQTHTEEHRAVTRKQRTERRRRFRQRTDEVKQRFGCCVCGEADYFCLDFHHLNPNTKEIDIAMATAREWAWETVLAEIRKCVCLCANCHRKVHAGRFEVTEDMLCDV